ncbi:glycosyltransferase involved in cell wall biosynthesis [Chryseobacterium sp. H1D6B]|uniref:glycosyltransferase n=1 Tax=Chryseobacterium sp. H1D6B TaxID=2940588 RepID=UPI0015C9D744|nr:glycosyltransferase [Chryseobacterium sp. H1D6B]MDH6251391.1 glycosyltransferase involved in cell wall biosynthesis [Chryseobacterium sp. H1D6B]
MSKILFLTTAHQYNDDRIFYHQAKELKAQGHEIKISSLCSDYQGTIDGIEIESYPVIDKSAEEKTKVFQNICDSFQPDCIICSEPLAVIAAKKYKKKKKAGIVYDITEWYPSMRMVENYTFPFNVVHAVKFFLIQLYAGYNSTHFIFGEKTKEFPLAYVFPFKKKLILPYYPDDVYISESIKKLEPSKINVCYTGAISKEKGIENFFNAVDSLRKKRPDIKISILIVGGTRKEKDELYFSSLLSQYAWENITIEKPISFQKFTESYAGADICFDLRDLNFENDHCLPIKLFYYAASGKPVIYTDLKATRQHIDVSKFGYLVDPEDSELISSLMIKYIENPELYDTHAQNARKLYQEKYNWGRIRNSFIDFVRQSIYKN